jgi:hypothetical protein
MGTVVQKYYFGFGITHALLMQRCPNFNPETLKMHLRITEYC